MGAMKFNTAQQRGTRCKELGPNVGISVAPSSNYQELLEKGKTLFFDSSEDYSYFLADGQGSKLPDNLDGHLWTLMEYMNKHGYHPCKTRFYCVQVSIIISGYMITAHV